MTAIHWIATVWLLGAVAAFATLVHDWDEEQQQKYVDSLGGIMSPWFIKLAFYVVAFIDSLLVWPMTLLQVLWRWLRMKLVFIIVNRIVTLANKGELKKASKMTSMLGKLTGKPDSEEEKKDLERDAK